MPLGDGVQFEGSPTGWPPLSRRVIRLYLAVLLTSVVVMLAGHDIPLKVRGVILHLPVFVPVLAAIGVCELWRLAVYRSTVYSLIHGRTLVVQRGVLRVRMDEVHSLLPGFELRGGDPALMTEFGWIVLEGLGPESRDGVLGALGLPPLAEAPPHARSRRREVLAAVVALLVLVAAHVDGAIGAAAKRNFDALDARVRAAVFRAESRFVIGQEIWLDQRSAGHAMTRALLMTRTSLYGLHFMTDETRPSVAASIDVECKLPCWTIFWGPPRVTVTVHESAPGNERLQKVLEAAFAEEEVQAVWPGH
jgi:hypothetical protein